MDPAHLPIALGEFRLEAVLGEGGSGIVYDATWGPRRVALKVLHPQLADTDRVRAQFLAEGQRLQAITHASVVKVLAVGELPDGRPYLAMERLEGETLASVLGRGAMTITAALELFGALCSAVGTLHEQGMIHRDLKPENVFIVDGKHAVLLDFGIAKDAAAPASTTTIDGGVRGTPAYMAPERFFGQPASVATDLYELAVTFYAMLAGRLPWDDLADPEARLQPRPLVELAPVPVELDVEIRRALSTRAQNRPASAGVLYEAVRVAAGGAGGATPTAGETARMRPATGAPEPRHTTGAPRGTDDASPPRPTVTAERTPWFAGRQTTTDRGKTPLAWAPTEHAPASAPSPARRRWPVIAAIAAAVGLAVGVVAWRVAAAGEDEAPVAATTTTTIAETAVDSPPPPTNDPDDPWGGGRAAPPAPSIATSGPELDVATAAAELARAIPHLPADTSMVVAALVGPLRRDARLAPLFDKLGAHPKVALLVGMLPPCVKSLVAASEWFAFGSTGFEAHEQGTLIVRGRWQRADVERCFDATGEPREMPDGARMLQLPELGWVDFMGPSTVYLSVRQDLAAAQVHANASRPLGLTKRARSLLATLPKQRAFTFVVDGTGGMVWPGDPVPKGTNATAWLSPDEDAVSLGVMFEVGAVPAATELEQTLRTQLGSLFDGASDQVGKVSIQRDRTTVRLAVKLSALMMGIVTAAIQ